MRILVRSTLLFLLSLSVPGIGSVSAQELPPPTPKAVVGFHDTGINPYHQVFRTDDPYALQHPSTYIPGYPSDAIALPITLPPPEDEADWATLVRDDCLLWRSVQPGKLYWFPGTRIIGAISFNPSVNGGCTNLPASGTEILDYNGHGTMVASRGASSEYGACLGADCRIVAVQSPMTADTQPAIINGVNWLADQSGWVDVQSNSWGPIVPLWEPTGQIGLWTASPPLVQAIERANQRHASFWASGNGIAFRFGVLGHPTVLAAHFGVSGYIVGGHDSGYMNTWPGFSPHVVADSCSAWAAIRNHTTQSGDSVSGGTSGATPFVAGGAGKLILEARRILGDLGTGFENDVVASGQPELVPSGPLADGSFTSAELRSVLLKTATARPGAQFEDGPRCTDPLYGSHNVKWTDVPAAYPEYVQIGYGAVDRVAQELAAKVIRGESALPDRSATDQYFTVDNAVRSTLHIAFRGAP
jgi:hypothetical protein